MDKGANFSGQPVFSQLINLIPKSVIAKASMKHKGDHYVKKFNTYHHVVTMLFAQFQDCCSLREVVLGMLACQGKLNHLGLTHFPKRSTIAEANARRSHLVFQDLYFALLKRYSSFLADSRNSLLDKRLFILDATVISLFQDILPAAGRNSIDGKRKGGIKVHAVLNAALDLPEMIILKPASHADRSELQNVHLPPKSILVFDKGYVNFDQFNRFTRDQISWVTRKTSSWNIEVMQDLEVEEHQHMNGVLKDQLVIIGNTINTRQTRVKARLVTYYDEKSDRTFEFVTNNLTMSPITIAQLYQKRWQVELLFKRIKQNSQLYNFIGDNENAIKIQIWCSLLSDLLTKIIQKKIRTNLAYSSIVKLIQLHFLSYFNLVEFLNNPTEVVKEITGEQQTENQFSSA